MIVAGWADGYTNIALRGVRGADVPAPRDHRAVGAHVDGELDPRAAHRPRAGAHPLVLALAARRAERDRRGAADRGLRPTLDAAGRRPRRRCAASGAPSRRGPPSGSRTRRLRPEGDGTDRIAVRGDVGTAAWISCAGRPPWTLPDDQREDDARSLTYDWEPLDDGARDPRAPAAPRHGHVAAPGRVPLGAALRRLPRRHVGAREPRDPQPHAPGRATTTPSHSSPVSRRPSSSSSRRRRGSSSRAIAFASRSRARTGRTRGRRRTAGTLEVARASVELELPVLEGPSTVAPPPAFAPPPATGAPSTDEPDGAAARRAARSSEDSSAQTRVVTSYGSAYDGPFDAQIEERYDGRRRGVHAKTRAAPGRARRTRYQHRVARGRRCATEAHLAPPLDAEHVPRRRRGRRRRRTAPDGIGARRAPLRADDPAPSAVAAARFGHLAQTACDAAASWTRVPKTRAAAHVARS